MTSDDIPDWENHEETPPDNLRKKWEREEYEERPAVQCRSCKNRVPSDSFRCLYCGAQIFKDSGFLGKILKWFRFGR